MSRPLPRPLYLMIKPPLFVAERIAEQARAARVADLLHVTLLMLGDRREFSDFAVSRVVEALGRVRATAFRMTFDCIHESERTVALRACRPSQDLIALQGALRAALIREGIALPADRFHPHMTLGYRRDERGSGAIAPISWLVEDVCLIESVYGEGRHIEHGRFALRPAPIERSAAKAPSHRPVWRVGRDVRRQSSTFSTAQRQLALF